MMALLLILTSNMISCVMHAIDYITLGFSTVPLEKYNNQTKASSPGGNNADRIT